LAETPPAAHSCFVAYVMQELAVALDADADLWEVVGLCHDLDFFATSDEEPARHSHGEVAEGSHSAGRGTRSPHTTTAPAFMPIRRSPMRSRLPMPIAVVDATLGRRTLREVPRDDPVAELRRLLPDRPYLCDMLEKYAARRGLSIAHVIEIAAASPVPSR
jgi:HD domain